MSYRLLQVLRQGWESFDGYSVAHNMPDLRTIDLGRLCNFVYWKVTDGGDEKEIDKFRGRLWRPPHGEEPDSRSPWSAENEMTAFRQARQALGAT